MGRRRKKFPYLENVRVTGIADKGRSVGRTEAGQVVFVEDAVPGDVTDVQVNRKKKGVLFGYSTEIKQYSLDRTEATCTHFGLCGGCKWQHLTYEAQLRHKQTVTEDALLRLGKLDIGEMQTILPSLEQTYYRNKLEYSFSNKKWLTREQIDSGISNLEDVLGFHKAGAFDKIINIDHCYLQPAPSNALRNYIQAAAIEQGLSFYDARAQEGFMRNMVLRITSIGEVMLTMSVREEKPELYRPLFDGILQHFPEITSFYYCINGKVNDYLMDLEMRLYNGKAYVEEQMGHVRFKIGPKSFFQTNTKQGARLYDTVVEFANLQGTENVYDLYTGIGSIALYVAQNCQQVVGIEEIAPAIDDARENAHMNGIENTTFYAGDVKDILTPEFAVKHGKPDVLITDPPRAGMHPKVVQMLLQLAAPRIVYVSCNPATQARDLAILSEKYKVLKARPVDMFPHTHHIESVALLELK
ncbi:MAG: 23S rRNA (uracil(1939)-C(5))-methyltransferase RlmD [Bacteroidota bacterium]